MAPCSSVSVTAAESGLMGGLWWRKRESNPRPEVHGARLDQASSASLPASGQTALQGAVLDAPASSGRVVITEKLSGDASALLERQHRQRSDDLRQAFENP